MLDSMKLAMNLLLFGANIRASLFAPSSTPAADGGAAQS
jgi:hypothetical protein